MVTYNIIMLTIQSLLREPIEQT